ncbi:acyl-protein thioesterase, partial [Metarhizium majus ARSEF 297]
MDAQPKAAKERQPGSAYIVEPSSNHTYSLILLHGLGSNGEKFGSELMKTALCSDSQSLPELLPGARFIFPTAKRRRSSAFGRSKITQWFDIASLDDPSHRQQTQVEGLEESLSEILKLVNEERDKVSAHHVLLGGLSQGSAMAAICLLYLQFPVGGFVGMSGWLPYRNDIHEALRDNAFEDNVFEDENPFDTFDCAKTEDQDPILKAVDFVRDLLGGDNQSPSQNALTTPVFLGHGTADEKISITFMRKDMN